MSDLSDRPLPSTPTSSPASNLRLSSAAVRVSFTWFGTRKAVTSSQRDQMAEGFDADGQYLSAGKKLVNTKHPKFKAVTGIKTQIQEFWKANTLPFPEDGIRLLRQSALDGFEQGMQEAREDLRRAVEDLDAHYGEIREEARARLGALFNPEDYPSSLVGLFGVAWDYPSVEPPDYLLELKPALYEQERARVAARFDEAVRLAEQGFAEEFAKVVSHLCERLNGFGPDGKPKVFRDSAVNNAMEFFERFSSLNVGSNAQLDTLVEQARAAVQGVAPKTLRTDGTARHTVSEQLAAVREQLDGMIVDRPRRKIIRPAATPAPAPEAVTVPEQTPNQEPTVDNDIPF